MKTDIDPDAVYRTLRLLNAVKSWAHPTFTLYQLGSCTVEVFDRTTTTLFVSGPSEDETRNAIARLGFDPERVTITPSTLNQ
jgi:hypothetical protein